MFRYFLSFCMLVSVSFGVDCSVKKTCKQMKSCKEAKEYLQKCGFKKLDRDNDGIPCESICKSKK